MEAKIINVETSGILSFKVDVDADGRPLLYNLEVEGKPAYQISNMCGTCYSLYERVESANLPLAPREVSAHLERGFPQPSAELIETAAALLPPGKYVCSVIEVGDLIRRAVSEAYPGANDGRPTWMWERTISEGKVLRYSDHYFDFSRRELILPLVSGDALYPPRIQEYEEILLGGGKPIALALSVIDAYPWITFGPIEWNLSHFLIDGHHKVAAAANLGMPITILSFLSIRESNTPVFEDEFVCKHYGLPGPWKAEVFTRIEPR